MTEVLISRCGSYAPSDVERSVSEIFTASGIMGSIVKPGMRILIKPNLLSDRPPADCVTTHPEIVKAVIRAVRNAGAACFVGDSPAMVHRGLERNWKTTGMLDACNEAGAKMVSFEDDVREFKMDGYSLWLSGSAFSYDAVINLPKMKTHTLTVITGAVKNLYGFVPGYSKTAYHKMRHRPRPFSSLIVDILEKIRPAFSLMDAVQAMEGDGPSGGRPKHVGCLIASRDPVAIDAAFCGIVGLDPMKPFTNAIASARNLGVADLSKISFPMLGVKDVRPGSFELPGTSRYELIPDFVPKLLSRFFWIRPDFNDRCIGCGSCAEKCPAKAIVMAGGRPKLEAGRCVECFCCHEICPAKAIDFKRSALARLVIK